MKGCTNWFDLAGDEGGRRGGWAREAGKGGEITKRCTGRPALVPPFGLPYKPNNWSDLAGDEGGRRGGVGQAQQGMHWFTFSPPKNLTIGLICLVTRGGGVGGGGPGRRAKGGSWGGTKQCGSFWAPLETGLIWLVTKGGGVGGVGQGGGQGGGDGGGHQRAVWEQCVTFGSLLTINLIWLHPPGRRARGGRWGGGSREQDEGGGWGGQAGGQEGEIGGESRVPRFGLP